MRIQARGHRWPTEHRKGFTIVELVVAVVVLTIGLLASASVVGRVTYRQMRATSRIEMMTVAENQLEHLRVIATSRSDDTVRLKIGGSYTAPTGIYTSVFTTPAGKQYRTQWLVAAGPGGSRAVTLRVLPVNKTRSDMTRLDFTALITIL